MPLKSSRAGNARSEFNATSRKQLAMAAANSAWNIANFRGRLLRELLDNGYGVVAAGPLDDPGFVDFRGCLFVLQLFESDQELATRCFPWLYRRAEHLRTLAAGLIGVKANMEAIVEYPGETDDVPPFMVRADRMALPSCREGPPPRQSGGSVEAVYERALASRAYLKALQA